MHFNFLKILLSKPFNKKDKRKIYNQRRVIDMAKTAPKPASKPAAKPAPAKPKGK